MSEEKEVPPQLYPVEKIEESWWNMNTIGPDEDKALGEDMKAGGLYAIGPILITRKGALVNDLSIAEDIMVCVDGNQRLRWARKLKWPQIRAVIDPNITHEADARSISHNKNYERGHMDPWKEAENFHWLTKHGWTQNRIADEYHIDKSQVSKRLSLLDVDLKVKKELQELPRVTVTASHFEPIASLKPELQKAAVKEIKEAAQSYDVREQGTIPVRQVEQIARAVKDEDAKRVALEEQLKKYEKEGHAKCKRCRKSPKEKDPRGFPWVRCENWHVWNLRTGMTEVEEEMQRYPKLKTTLEEAKPKRAPFPNYLRTTYTLGQFKSAFSNYMVEALRDLKSVKNVDVEGLDKNGNRVTLSYDVTMIGVHLGHNDLHLNVEEKKYDSDKLKDFKSVVTTWPEITSKAKAKEAKENVGKIMDKHGEKLVVKRGPKPKPKKQKKRKRTKRAKRSKRGKRSKR